MSVALLLIDLQNDYFPGGALPLHAPDAAVAQAARLLAHWRAHGAPVVHVQHLSQEADATFFRPGSTGADLHPQVRPAPGEAVVTKHHPSAFRDTPLQALLHDAGVDHLVVAGMMTHMCVDTTVRAAADLGWRCTLAHDACTTLDLAFGGRTVAAADVQVAYVAALADGFADVRDAAALCGADSPL